MDSLMTLKAYYIYSTTSVFFFMFWKILFYLKEMDSNSVINFPVHMSRPKNLAEEHDDSN
jgi:hypothetical protein